MQSFIITLLTCSVTMSVLVLLYMIVTPLLAKRYSEKGRYYAWLVIVIGLIIPFRPQFSNAIVKVDMPSEVVTPVIQIGNGAPVTIPIDDVLLSPVLPNISWWQVAVVIWLIGTISFLAFHIIKHVCFIQMVKRWSENIADEQVIDLFQSLKAEIGISKRINLYLCSCVGSPMIVGFTDSRILLPKADFEQNELRFILKHELVHYKRKDLWYKLLVLIASAIHWFNPLIYFMGKAIDILCEISCDAEIIRSSDADTRQQYSETIIGVVRYHSKLKTALSTNFFGGKKGMKKRIFSIMDTRKKKTGLLIVCVMLISTMGTGFAFTANAATNGSQQSIKHTYVSRTDSLIQSFEKYKAFGVTYDAKQDAVYYNGEKVRLFVDFKMYKEEGMKYAFDLCYQSRDSDSTLYLEAVKDNNGKITGIRLLDNDIAIDILGEAKESDNSIAKTEIKDITNNTTPFIIVLDSTHIIENYGITATDMVSDEVLKNITNWITQCDKKQGAYILKAKGTSGYTTYVYYNGVGRCPWYMTAEGDVINISLYNGDDFPTNEGNYLMYYTAPKDFAEINMYLNNSELSYEVTER